MPDALHADRQPGIVHHGEHAIHAAVLLAEEIADGAAMIAVHHGAGGRAVDAELVLDRVAARVVERTQRAVSVGPKNFGTTNSEMPLVP